MSATTTYRVTWEIDVEAGTPREAAETVWKDIFGRDDASPNDACVFEVGGSDDSPLPVLIDLSQKEEEDE